MSRYLFCVLTISAVLCTSCDGGPSADRTDIDSAASEAQASDEELVGVVWEWVSTVTPVERFESVNPERYTLRFQADGRVEARFDCNNGAGDYTIDANQLSFGPLITTRMACPDDTQDSEFMRELEQISSYFIQDGELFLEMPFDSGTMRFRRAAD